MIKFECCSPFEVYGGDISGSPLFESESMGEAVEWCSSLPDGHLKFSVLVTSGRTSALVPLGVSVTDLRNKSEKQIMGLIDTLIRNRADFLAR